VIHVKANVDSSVKRGRPDFFPSQSRFDGVRKLLDNMLATAVDQAAITWIEQFPNATGDQIRQHVPDQVTTPGQTTPVNQPMTPFGFPLWPWPKTGNHFRPGTIIRTEGNRGFKSGPTSDGTSKFIEIVQAVLRAVGLIWGFPEYFSGDASNNNMA